MEIQNQDEVYREFSDICRKHDWRFTSSRFAVYKCIRHNKKHPIVDDVWKNVRELLPNISRESVYRILTDFANGGLIYTLERPDVVARYDSNPKPHHHFFCTCCGRIFDFFTEDLDPIVLEKTRNIGRTDRIEARIQGVCQDCLTSQASK